jgi:hypothetical protein
MERLRLQPRIVRQECKMRVESFFEWLGQALGTVIRYIVDALSGFFGLFADAGANFLEGLSRTLGMDRSLIGLMLLVGAFRAFFRRSFIAGVIYLFLGLWLLSWLIH